MTDTPGDGHERSAPGDGPTRVTSSDETATADGGDPTEPAADPLDAGAPESAESGGSSSGSGPGSSSTSTSASTPTAIGTAVVLGVLGPVIAVGGGLGVLALSTVLGGLPAAVSIVLTLIIGQYVAFGGLALGYLRWRGFDGAGIRSYLGIRRPRLSELGLVVGGWVLIVVTLFVVSSLVSVLGAETASNQSAEVAMQNPGLIPLFIVAMFLVVGPSEEVLYRGVVQGRLRESLPAVPAIGLASGIFAFIHVMALTGGISGRLTTVVILFFPSLVFGAVYEYTENLVVPALLHGLHNAVIFTVLYLTIAYGEELRALGGETAAALPV